MTTGKWSQAKYSRENKTAQYIDQTGSFLLRTGGSLPWRLNNPGNLRPRMVNGQPRPLAVKSHIGFAHTLNKDGVSGYFLIFPDYETGLEELRKNLKRLHSTKSVKEAINCYAPGNENNTDKYIDDIERICGIKKNEIVGKLDNEKFEKLVKSITRIEGYDALPEGPRKEQRGGATSVVLSDGSRPIAEQKVILRQQGKEHVLVSSQTGQLPPIVHFHGAGTLELWIKDAKGTLQQVLSFDAAKEAKSFLLTLEQLVVKSNSFRHPTTTTIKSPLPPPASYVVQPHDTLAKIAKRFNTTVDALCKINGIVNPNKIFPGKALRIGSIPVGKLGDKQQDFGNTPSKKASEPSVAVATKLPSTIPIQVTNTRSQQGTGAPMAALPFGQKRAPWMTTALQEAQRWSGLDESVIDDSINYHEKIGSKSFSSLEGTANAWCASFVNYCLMSSGYAISSPHPYRAKSFILDQSNFIEITSPVYGCVASSGSHATFFYGYDRKGRMIGLGGNQGQTIKFSPYKGMKYFIPAAYFYQYKLDAKELVEKYDLADLNKSIGIVAVSKKDESTR